MKLCSSDQRTAALTRAEVLLIVIIVGFLVFCFLSVLSAAKRHAQSMGCNNNLKHLWVDSYNWAYDNNDKYPMQLSATKGGTMELVENADAFVHFQAMSNKFTNPKILVCPADKKRSAAVSLSANFGNQNLSYFIDLDAEEGNATNILAGDRNLTLNRTPVTSGLLKLRTDSAVGWSGKLHRKCGGIVFADGHTESYLTNLQPFLRATGFVTNRLVIP